MLLASGRFSVDSFDPLFDGGFELGFFNANDLTRIPADAGVGGVEDAIAVRIIDGGGGHGGQLRFSARADSMDQQSSQYLDPGVDYLFELTYDPNGSGEDSGTLTVEFRRADDSSFVGSALLAGIPSGGGEMDLNAFGLVSLNFSLDPADGQRLHRRLELHGRARTVGALAVGAGRHDAGRAMVEKTLSRTSGRVGRAQRVPPGHRRVSRWDSRARPTLPIPIPICLRLQTDETHLTIVDDHARRCCRCPSRCAGGRSIPFEPLRCPARARRRSLVELLPGPQLFIDDYLIESTTGLSRRVNVPQRDPAIANPIVTGIEDHCTAPYSTVLQDPETGRYRIWYNEQFPDQAYGFAVSMMESDDGIHWERPHQVVKPMLPGQVGCAVIDEGPDYANPAARYKLGTFLNGGLNISASPDGVNWTPMTGTVVAHDHDINNIWYDPLRKRYVGIVSTYTTGPTWSGLRRVTMETVSQDLVHWADPWYVVTPDDATDPTETQFYAMQGHMVRGDLWIGMVKVLHDNWTAEGVPSGAYGMGHTELAWSRDGVNWVRDQTPFFEPDPTVGAWDHAHAWIDYQTIVGDEVYLYYGGYESGHKWNRYEERQLGLLRMDLDRYVSRDAGASGGILRTAPVLMVGVDSMTVNAKVDGQLRARLVDPLSGQPIPGFDFTDCTTVSGDSLAHTIQWTTPLASLGLTPVRIQFGLQSAQIYGFTLDGPGLPEPGPTETQSFDEEIPAFVAGWRGRNHTPADGLGADLAFRASNHAGGTPGEIGGTIPGRGEDFVTYADTTLGGDPSQADVLTASGRFRVDSLQPGFEGGFELGFFDGNTTVLDATGPSMGGVHDFVGVRFIDGAGDNGVLRWFARAGSLAGDMATPLAVGETYLFDLAYNPNGAAPG